jgi:hypothetical protein
MRPYLALWAAKVAASLAALQAKRGGLQAPPFGAAQFGAGVAPGYLEFRFAAEPGRPAHPRRAAWQADFDARASAIATTHRDTA